MDSSGVFKKIALMFFVLCAALYAGRMWYGYRTTPDEPITTGSRSRVPEVSFDLLVERRDISTVAGDGGETLKFDITADMVTASRSYDSDLRRLRAMLDSAGGETHFMRDVRRSDMTTRAVAIAAAVPSAGFDRFYAEVRRIGSLESSLLTTSDRTAEYRALTEARDALDETRREVTESRRGRHTSSEIAAIQDRLLEIGRDMRDLRTKLAPFEGASMVNLRVVLYEDKEITIPPPPIERRAMIAFKWAAKYSLVLTASLACFAAFIFLMAAMFGKVADIVAPRGRHARAWNAGPTVVPASIRIEAPEAKILEMPESKKDDS